MKLLFGLIVLAMVFIWGCADGGSSATSLINKEGLQQRSTAYFRIAINDPEVDEINVIITADDMDTINYSLMIVNDTAIGIVSDILVGRDRKFAVSAYKDGLLSYYGDTLASIIESDTTLVPVTLNSLFGVANFSIPVSENFPGVIDSIYASVVSNTDTLEITLDSGTVYTAHLSSIPVGESIEFSIYVISEGEVKYQGHTFADVNAGQPVDLSLNINPLVGSAEIVASIDTGWEGTINGTIVSPMQQTALPENGELFQTNEEIPIGWEESDFSDNVDINLLNNGVMSEQIASDISNDGYYEYIVPSTLESDNTYQIQITDGDTSITSGEFSITPDLTQNDLVVTLTWDNGTTSGGTSSEKIDVDLHIHTPEGEHIYYQNKQGSYDDYIDLDNTWGYGPEIYRRPIVSSGVFQISANVYNLGSAHNSVTIRIDVIINGVKTSYFETLSSEDSNGSDPNAWFEIPDVEI